MSHSLDPDLLRRLCEGDPIAPDQFCETYLPLLMADRRWRLPGIRDPHLIEEAAIQTVLDFVKRPDRYDPAKLPILSYLRMLAGNDLKNLIAKEARHARRRAPIEAVELHPSAGNQQQDGPSLPGGVSHELVRRRLQAQVPDSRDQEAMAMMIDGVRETAAYARVYGLQALPAEEQRKQVKRLKDRLDKTMKRLGVRLRGGA